MRNEKSHITERSHVRLDSYMAPLTTLLPGRRDRMRSNGEIGAKIVAMQDRKSLSLTLK